MQTEIARARVEESRLKKSLSLPEVIIYGVGIILGAGIYALIGTTAGIAGNTLWLSFVLAAVIASFSALSYAELTSLFPKCAAEFVYTKRATKSIFLAFGVGYIAVISVIISSTTVAVGFGGYFEALTGFPVIFSAAILILLLSILNWYGIKESAKFNIISTVIEAGGLVLIIVIGLAMISFGGLALPNLFEFPGEPANAAEMFSPIFAAAAIIFFAFLGFEDIANISEETKNAKVNIPIGLLAAVAITTVIYVLVAVVSVSAVPYAVLGESTAPLADVASALGGESFGILSGNLLGIIALFATANTVLILLIVASRMFYGMAKEKSLPAIFGKVDKKRGTPVIAIIFVLLLSALLLFGVSDKQVDDENKNTLPENADEKSDSLLSTLASLTNFGVFIIFFSVNASLIILRFTEPGIERPFKVPFSIGKVPLLPLLGALFCLYMLTHITGNATIFGFELPIVLLGIILYLTFIPVYLIFVRPPFRNAIK
ncbi:MAG: APC family permease [Candidatus Diapherotrites archaeon]